MKILQSIQSAPRLKNRRDVVIKTLLRSIRRYLEWELANHSSPDHYSSDSQLSQESMRAIITAVMTNTNEELRSASVIEWLTGFAMSLVNWQWAKARLPNSSLTSYKKFTKTVTEFSTGNIIALTKCKDVHALLSGLSSSDRYKEFVTSEDQMSRNLPLYLSALKKLIKMHEA